MSKEDWDEAARRLLDDRTGDKWAVEAITDDFYDCIVYSVTERGAGYQDDEICRVIGDDDAELIAAAPGLLETALAEIDGLNKKIWFHTKVKEFVTRKYGCRVGRLS